MAAILGDNAHMGTDRHKPSKLVRVKKVFEAPLELLAERNATSLPDEVNRAVRELLQRENLWPPPEKQPRKKKDAPADSDS